MTTTPTLPVRYRYDDQPVVAVWWPLMLRLQSVAKKGTPAVISIRVVVDENGEPQWYGRPVVTPIEPKAKAGALAKFLDALGE